MASIGDIAARLKLDTSDFMKGVKEASSAGEQLRGTFDKLVAVAGFGGLSAALAKASSEASGAVVAAKKLDIAFAASGKSANTAGLREFADQLSKTTNFEDDATIGAMGLLASFKLNEDQIRTLTPRIQDVAEFMGVDLATAARMTGTAIETGTNTLQRMGVTMTEAQQSAFKYATAEERVGMMAEVMQQKLGGAAEALVSPFKQLENAGGDLLEEIGGLFNDELKSKAESMRGVISGITDAIHGLSPGVKEVVGRLLAFAAGGGGLLAIVSGIAVVLPSMAEGFMMIGTALKAMMTPMIPVVAMLSAMVASLGFIKMMKDIGGPFTKAEDRTPEQQAAFEKYQSEGAGDSLTGAIKTLMGTGLKLLLPEGLLEAITPKDVDLSRVGNSTNFSTGGQQRTAFGDPYGIDKGLADFANSLPAQLVARTASLGAAFDRGMRHGSDAWLAAAWDSDPGDGFAAGFYNAVVDFTSGFSDSLRNLAADGAVALGQAGSAFAGAMLSGVTGLAADVLKAAQQGFAQGGIWGAIGGMVGTLLTKTTTFKGIMAGVNGTLENVSQLLGTILQPLGAIMQVMNPMVQLLNSYVAPVLQLFADAIGKVLFAAIKGVTLVVLGVAWAIGQAWNGIVSSIQWTFRKIGDIPFMGKFNDWADSLDRLKINTDKLSDAMKNLDGMTYDQAVAANEAAGADQAKTDAAQELLNVPTGYKLDLTRFEASQGDAYRNGGAAVAPQTTPLVDNSVVIENLNVTADNPADAAEKILAVIERRTYVRTGSTSGVALPYAVPAIP